jgi:hypothetical protein
MVLLGEYLKALISSSLACFFCIALPNGFLQSMLHGYDDPDCAVKETQLDRFSLAHDYDSMPNFIDDLRIQAT